MAAKYSDFVYYEGTTTPLVGTLITVYDEGTQNLSSLFDSGGAPIANPVTTDTTGYFEFYVQVAGNYDLYYYGSKVGTVAINFTDTASSFGGLIAGASAKSPLVDADVFAVSDSENSNVMVKFSWASLKAGIKAYYDAVTSTMANKTLTAPVINTPTISTPTFDTAVTFPYKTTLAGTVVGTRAVTGAATLLATDNTLEISTGASAAAVDLSAAVVGQIVTVRKADAGAGLVTFADTINGSTSFTLSTQYEVVTMQCTATGVWSIL